MDGCLPDGSGALDSPEWHWGNEIVCSAEPYYGKTRVIARRKEETPPSDGVSKYKGFTFGIDGFEEGKVANDLPTTAAREIGDWEVATWFSDACTVSITENTSIGDTDEGRAYRISGNGACTMPLQGDGDFGKGTFDLPSFSFTVRGLFP